MLELLNHSSDTVVGRLVVSAADDPLRQRLRLSSLLGSANVQPPGLPASAILVVRKLSDPSPHLLGSNQQSWFAPPEWERQVRDSIAHFVSLAARPARGDFAGSASAVLFWDRAELLSCLARDWCTGSIGTRWWWRLLLRNDFSFWNTWIGNPEYVPAAMELLARRNQAVEFASSLTEEQAQALTRRVVTTFALHELTSLFEISVGRTRTDEPAEVLVRSRDIEQTASLQTSQQQLSAPWRDRLPEVIASSLSDWPELFIGLTLMISRAPALVRTHSFARVVEQWQQRESVARREQAPAQQEKHREVLSTETVLDTFTSRSDSAPAEAKLAIDAIESRAARTISANEPPFADMVVKTVAHPFHQNASDKLLRDETKTVFDRPLAPSRDDAGALAAHSIDDPAFPHIEPTQAAIVSNERLPGAEEIAFADNQIETAPIEPTVSEVFEGVEIETELGGLFYLINLALYLDLYGDFTRPAEIGIELNIWDFVSLVGAELIEAAVADDPVWSLLATLAGRDDEMEIGDAFQPPAEWRPPTEWAPAIALEQLDEERRRDRFKIKAPVAIKLWLSRLMPYARARLRAALGVDINEDLGALVCRHVGTVRVTSAHVDVFFNLSEHPIELRMAGLDRDPGWVPAAGRFISFHYN
jgi:hypothetical protein